MAIPILNQPFEALSWYPTALIKCNCQGPQQFVIVIITGINNMVICQKCETGYIITGIRPDGTLDIGVARPQATGTVQ